ncbi:MAG TPA: 4'-phosphopantetheinyl transferase superfamily protein [Bacteroidota bacterium]|nr:4'-phosphopantetheinyl transferase superfamily protein [Bacteroidota bacterium]
MTDSFRRLSHEAPLLRSGLAEGEIHVWSVGLDAGPVVLADCRRVLPESEAGRAARFRDGADGDRFILAHGSLRLLLGAYSGGRPDDLEFECGEHGKPRLASAVSIPGLAFSLAHARRAALIAVSGGSEVGVDIEEAGAVDDLPLLAAECFSPAERLLFDSAAPSRRAGLFYTFWTRKEAYLKGRGVGFSVDPRSVDVSAPGWMADGRWHVRDIGDAHSCASALAVERAPGRVRFMQLM